MNSKIKVSPMYGVVGCGVVGSAVIAGLEKNQHDWWGYDPQVHDTRYKFGSVFKTQPPSLDLAETATIFLCLPTLASDIDEGYNLGPLVSALNWLAQEEYQGTVIVVSTVSSEDFHYLLRYSSNKKAAYSLFVSPEFLTAKNANKDFYEPGSPVVYGPTVTVEAQPMVEESLKAPRSPGTKFFNMTAVECCLLKTWRNVALAQKLLTANMIYFDARLQGLGAECAQQLVDQVFSDSRLKTEEHYTKVGNEEQTLGFAGACLPKDLEAMALSMPNNAMRNYLEAAQRLNNGFRTMYDTSIDLNNLIKVETTHEKRI
jgi:UDP-glucose 6-dehydrogenase